LKIAVGGLSKQKIERKASIGSSTNSSVVNPRIQDSIVTICLSLSEKMVAKYEGLFLGV